MKVTACVLGLLCALLTACNVVRVQPGPDSLRTNYGRTLMTENSAHSDLTDKENASLEVLIRLGDATIREWVDAQETDVHGSERTSYDEQRARAERLEAKGEVVQYEADGKQRYRPAT